MTYFYFLTDKFMTVDDAVVFVGRYLRNFQCFASHSVFSVLLTIYYIVGIACLVSLAC